MEIILIQMTKDELNDLIVNAIRQAMPKEVKQREPEPFIKGIHQLAKFLQVSPVRAQKLKNEGAFPYWQDGRTLLFDPEKVRDSMAKIKTTYCGTIDAVNVFKQTLIHDGAAMGQTWICKDN